MQARLRHGSWLQSLRPSHRARQQTRCKQRRSLTVATAAQHCARVPHVSHQQPLADEDSRHGCAAVVVLGGRLLTQVLQVSRLVRLGCEATHVRVCRDKGGGARAGNGNGSRTRASCILLIRGRWAGRVGGGVVEAPPACLDMHACESQQAGKRAAAAAPSRSAGTSIHPASRHGPCTTPATH